MRAAVTEAYGPPEVVRVMDLPQPTLRSDEVLIRVNAAAVSSADARIRAAHFPRGYGVLGRLAFGWHGPRQPVLGSAYSGVVLEVGRGVSWLVEGDAVCGMAGMRLGAHAEFLCVRSMTVSRRPRTVSDEDAAGVLFGGSAALHYLRDRANLRPGESLLVNGASGAIGTCAVQLGRLLGAEVTAMASPPNFALISDLGAHHLVNYQRCAPQQLPDRFDVVMDTVGNLSIAAGRQLLKPGGRLLLLVANLAQTLRARGCVMAGPAPETADIADKLIAMLLAKTLRVVHDSSFSLDDIVHAHRRVDAGRKVGNVILQIS